MTTGKTIALTRWAFVSNVMSLLFNMLSRMVIAFLPRSKWKRIWEEEKNILAEQFVLQAAFSANCSGIIFSKREVS